MNFNRKANLNNNNVIIYILSSLILFAADSLNAQVIPGFISLEQAREYALMYNKTLMNARNNIIVSDEKVKEVKAQGLPQVEGTLDFLTYFNYELELDFGMGSSTPPDINVGLLDAGDWEVLNVIGQMFGSSEPIIMNNQSSAKVQLSQLIFSGQYLAGVQTARIARELAAQSLKRTEVEIIENVTNSYYLILATEHTLEIINKTLENLNITLQHTKNLYMAGVAEETDVDQILSAVNQLINTRKSLERAIQLNYNLLKFQLGAKPDLEIELTDKLDEFLANIEMENQFFIGYDITKNTDYQLMETQVKLSEKEVEMNRWAYGPTIAGFYSYTEKIVTTDFDITPKHVAGASMSLPIFSSGMRKAKLNQAKIGLDMAQRNQELVREQLELQEKQFLFNLRNALENYATQKENVRIAERLYNSIQNKYNQGLLSSLDLTQANTNYLNAENNYLNSVLTLLQANLSLEKLYNTFNIK